MGQGRAGREENVSEELLWGQLLRPRCLTNLPHHPSPIGCPFVGRASQADRKAAICGNHLCVPTGLWQGVGLGSVPPDLRTQLSKLLCTGGLGTAGRPHGPVSGETEEDLWKGRGCVSWSQREASAALITRATSARGLA